jgi:hypothetical protein
MVESQNVMVESQNVMVESLNIMVENEAKNFYKLKKNHKLSVVE